MASDVTREIDQNFAVPEGLKYTTVRVPVEDESSDDDIDIQIGSHLDDSSELDEEEISGDIETPENIDIISQDVRTAPDGRQVIDVVIEVTDVVGAINYDVRITKLEEE